MQPLSESVALNKSEVSGTPGSVGVGAVTGRVLTPVTYYPVSMQKQFFQNQAAIREKPYAEFFQRDLTVPMDWAKALQQGPMPLEQTLTPSVADVNKILNPSFKFPDAGYALLDGPTAIPRRASKWRA